MTLEKAASSLRFVENRIAAVNGQRELLQKQVQDLDISLDTLSEQEATYSQALVVLTALEMTWRGRYEDALAQLGSEGLSSIFGDERQVVLETSTKRGVASLDIALIKDGERVRIRGGSGGSVAQILSATLRVMMSLRPHWRPFLMLDEPFGMVAAEQRPALCQMVREMVTQLGLQFLFTSHEDELADAAEIVVSVHPGGVIEVIKTEKEERL